MLGSSARSYLSRILPLRPGLESLSVFRGFFSITVTFRLNLMLMLMLMNQPESSLWVLLLKCAFKSTACCCYCFGEYSFIADLEAHQLNFFLVNSHPLTLIIRHRLSFLISRPYFG